MNELAQTAPGEDIQKITAGEACKTMCAICTNTCLNTIEPAKILEDEEDAHQQERITALRQDALGVVALEVFDDSPADGSVTIVDNRGLPGSDRPFALAEA